MVLSPRFCLHASVSMLLSPRSSSLFFASQSFLPRPFYPCVPLPVTVFPSLRPSLVFTSPVFPVLDYSCLVSSFPCPRRSPHLVFLSPVFPCHGYFPSSLSLSRTWPPLRSAPTLSLSGLCLSPCDPVSRLSPSLYFSLDLSLFLAVPVACLSHFARLPPIHLFPVLRHRSPRLPAAEIAISPPHKIGTKNYS